MRLEFKIHENDFLAFQLFAASQSERIRKEKNKSWLILTIGSVVLAAYFLLNQNISMAVFFGLVGMTCGLFYPLYFRWRYKRHYKSYIKENYHKRFGQTEVLEINDDHLFMEDKTGEGKINLKEIEKVDETVDHFFMKISTGVSVIIPKDRVDNINELINQFEKIGLKVDKHLDMRCKCATTVL